MGMRPQHWKFAAVAILVAAIAAVVGYTTSKNPSAPASGTAVEVRVLVIVALLAVGMYLQRRMGQTRMGALLIGVGFLSALWLLNGSGNRLLFSIGVVAAGAMPVSMAYLMLAHPTGSLLRAEKRFLWLTGGALALLWLLEVAMTHQPPLRTPLLQCTLPCPSNASSLGSAPGALGAVRLVMNITWVALAVGTPFFIARRARSSSEPVRRSMIPVTAVSAASAVLLTSYVASDAAGSGLAEPVGLLYAATLVAMPVAILAGLGRERLFMGQRLAEFVRRLARLPNGDPGSLMAAAFGDGSLQIVYAGPRSGAYINSDGQPVPVDLDDKAVAWINRNGRPVAAVLYDPDLKDHGRFVQAAGAAALIRLEQAQLEADFRATSLGLSASRRRQLELSDAERRRLERDLHDGVQQQLVGLRLKVAAATDSIKEDPANGEQALAMVGRQLDGILQEVRALARGVYPSLLTDYGLREALKAAAINSPIPVELHSGRIRRYPEDLEVAVYFSCLEALQNVAKHAGADAVATVTLHEDGPRLQFEVRDDGAGFDPESSTGGNGLLNMRDRIEAVGGTVEVISQPGRGTCVRGTVPVTFPSDEPRPLPARLMERPGPPRASTAVGA